MKKYLEIYTDEKRFEAFRKKNGLTKRKTWDHLKDALQIWAWGDIYEGMQDAVTYDNRGSCQKVREDD